MKEQNKQILSMLEAFSPSEVMKAIDLYKTPEDRKNERIEMELKEDGWFSVNDKPKDTEFYYLSGKYWIQSPEKKKEAVERIFRKKAEKKQPTQRKKYTGQKMDLKAESIICPTCLQDSNIMSKMYKQNVCGGCSAGKKGFKIRLLCEENPDHEILL